MHGEVYGFVQYSKVCDVDKLLKAVNNMHFGQFRVRAKLARFDKIEPKEVVRELMQMGEERRDVRNEGGAVKGREKGSEEEKKVRKVNVEGEGMGKKGKRRREGSCGR